MTVEAPSSEEIWFHEEAGERKGPLTEARMAELIKAAKLKHGASVWKKGFTDWLKIENTDLRVHLPDNAMPPPLGGDHVNNTVIWVLAFAPLLGYFLEYFIAGLVYGSNPFLATLAVKNNKFWYVTLLLNIGLSLYDAKLLKKAGHNTDAYKGMAFIVPVYLYQRAKNLKQNLAYFIVWLVCFGLILVA